MNAWDERQKAYKDKCKKLRMGDLITTHVENVIADSDPRNSLASIHLSITCDELNARFTAFDQKYFNEMESIEESDAKARQS